MKKAAPYLVTFLLGACAWEVTSRFLKLKDSYALTVSRNQIVDLANGFTVESSGSGSEFRIDYHSPKGILATVSFDALNRQAIFMGDLVKEPGVDRMSMIMKPDQRSIVLMNQDEYGKGVTTFDLNGDGVPERKSYTSRGSPHQTVAIKVIEEKQ